MPATTSYNKNPDHYRAKSREYYAAHRKERLAYARRYQKANKKLLREKSRVYREANRDIINAKQRAYRESNLEKRRAYSREYGRAHPRRARNYGLWYRHGLSVADYRALLKRQKHCCAVCGKKPRKYVVDHDHKTGKIRGLLCSFCNSLLGFAKDNRSVLKAAIHYLSKTG
jgi:hypothetical protein